MSQQLLTHMAAKQKPASLTLGWSEEEGIGLAFDEQASCTLIRIKKLRGSCSHY